MSNVHKNASNSSINQDVSATTRNLLKSISGKLRMIWSKQDMKSKEIMLPSSSISWRVKANKVNLMDKVACKWEDNSHTITRTKVVKWTTARWTWEAAAKEVEEDSNVDAEEADKETVVEVNTGTRITDSQVAHNNSDMVNSKSPWEWWVMVWTHLLRWPQVRLQWCLHNNSQWWWTKVNNLHNSNSQPSKTPCSFLKSTLRNLINSRVMKETTLLVTISTCLSCRPSVKNLPQPLPVCFLMSQLSISNSCFPKTNTSSLKPERLTTFLFRVRTNSSNLKCRASPRWISESHEIASESKQLY